MHCTNFNLRFFPLVHEARARVLAGEVGDVWNVHGGYLQDWLLYPTDWNWRLEPDKGGALRAIGDIGSHYYLHFEVDGSEAALAWNAERNEELWLGRRDEPNGILQRNPGLMQPTAASHSFLPAGHAEGWVETFRELYRAVYTAAAAGAPPADPDFPTFADGHSANVLGDAIALSHRERRWVQL